VRKSKPLGGAIYFAPNALAQATRRRWMTPSGMIARGSPLRVLNSRMRPTNFSPGGCPLFVFSNASRASPPADHIGVETHGRGLKTRHHPSMVLNTYRPLS